MSAVNAVTSMASVITALRARRSRPDADRPLAGPSRWRFWLVWAAPFAVILAVLLVRNAALLGSPNYEVGDMGANSILIEQARRWTLLVGNYSREHFNHPGPAFLYVQSWGESLFWAVLHVVPTPWNGQLIAVYILNALLAAAVVAIGYGWTRSARGAIAVFAVVLLFGALHPALFASDWMPYVYMPAYFLFMVAIASVAAGRTGDLWIAAIAGWFCVHGQACFLLFVPATTACAIVALAWPRRRRLGAALRSFFATQRRVWIPVLAICAVFLAPIVAELVLHWPGNFGKYFAYGSSKNAGNHGLTSVVRYDMWFWWPHAHAWIVIGVLCAAAVAAAWWCPAGPVRRVCVSLVAFDVIFSVLMLAYTTVGIDALSQYYIGYFYWSAPVIMVLVIVLALLERFSPAGARRACTLGATTLVTVGALAAGAVFATSPFAAMSTVHGDPVNLKTGPVTDPAIPGAVRELAALAHGRPIVITVKDNAWIDMPGFLVQAERAGVTACTTANWEFMITSEFVCSASEMKHGARFIFWNPGPDPHGYREVISLRRALVTFGTRAT
jgi:hypothetical protein